MPVKTIAMKRLEGQKRTFYMDEHGPYRHVDVDFYPAELVEKIIEDLSNQVLEERKKWDSLFEQYRNKRKELRQEKHDAQDALHKLRLAFAESQYALYFWITEHGRDVNERDYALKRLRFWTRARNKLAYTEMLRQKGIHNGKTPLTKNQTQSNGAYLCTESEKSNS